MTFQQRRIGLILRVVLWGAVYDWFVGNQFACNISLNLERNYETHTHTHESDKVVFGLILKCKTGFRTLNNKKQNYRIYLLFLWGFNLKMQHQNILEPLLIIWISLKWEFQFCNTSDWAVIVWMKLICLLNLLIIHETHWYRRLVIFCKHDRCTAEGMHLV